MSKVISNGLGFNSLNCPTREDLFHDESVIFVFSGEDTMLYSPDVKRGFVFRDGKMVFERIGCSTFPTETVRGFYESIIYAHGARYLDGNLEIRTEKIFCEEISKIRKADIYQDLCVLIASTEEVKKRVEQIVQEIDTYNCENEAITCFKDAIDVLKIFNDNEEIDIKIDKPENSISWLGTTVSGSDIEKLWKMYTRFITK